MLFIYRQMSLKAPGQYISTQRRGIVCSKALFYFIIQYNSDKSKLSPSSLYISLSFEYLQIFAMTSVSLSGGLKWSINSMFSVTSHTSHLSLLSKVHSGSVFVNINTQGRNRNRRPQLEPQINSLEKCKIR